MSLHDIRGCPVSTSDPASLQHYERALGLALGYYLDPLAEIERALERDPGFVMGHCLKAALMVLACDRMALPALTHSVEAIEALGRRGNYRERSHGAAARAWLHGDFAGAVQRYGEILLDYPHDLLALQAAHIGDFFLGATSMLRDRIAQVLPLWDPSIPGYGYVLGMYAFGLEETALYSRAEDMGRRALELQRRDPWAVHAVAHVMEMQGRLREGIDWLTTRESDWAIDNGFAFHNWWHLALFHLDLGDHAQALELYDRRIRPVDCQDRAPPAPLEMIDASAMLWRLQARGLELGERWQALARCWEPYAQHAFYAFNDAHAVMAFAGAGRYDLAQRTIAAMQRKAADADTNGVMTREVGLPVAQGLLAFAAGQYAKAIDLLLPVRTIAHRFGGSHAQRDLLHLTLVEAALRARHSGLARALIAERTQLKPASPYHWLLTARALELNGDAGGAAKARDGAEARRKAQLAAARAA